MKPLKRTLHFRKQRWIAPLIVSCLALFAGHFYLQAQDKSDFPDGYDAVQAAPNSHKVVFENSFVRVLEVTVPPPGTTEPMHHPPLAELLSGLGYRRRLATYSLSRPDGTVRDSPAVEEPIHPGSWHVHWMKPEPMHSIEVVDKPKSAAAVPDGPPSLRVEIKCNP